MKKLLTNLTMLSITALPIVSHAISAPMVSKEIFDKVEANTHWKSAFATGEQSQVVFMNISPATNPANEIGMETHQFDQIIFVVEGHGNAILNGVTTSVKEDDMIFVPLGTPHNVVNLDTNKPLKILSVYSKTDIPPASNFKTKADEDKK